ncbi:MAG: hypothetical protein FJ161_01630, partial [Gammaproteobacteria bacterium]|nr:hypothetical protein [Gammaproteobacteria bacterium]
MSQQVLSPSLSRVQIERLDRDGLGIGTNLDTGKTINKIPKVLPGESICGYEKKNGFQVTSIETASSERVAAICPVYDRCGGCSFQHFGAQRTLNFKRDLACDLLSSVLDRDQIQWAFE